MKCKIPRFSEWTARIVKAFTKSSRRRTWSSEPVERESKLRRHSLPNLLAHNTSTFQACACSFYTPQGSTSRTQISILNTSHRRSHLSCGCILHTSGKAQLWEVFVTRWRNDSTSQRLAHKVVTSSFDSLWATADRSTACCISHIRRVKCSLFSQCQDSWRWTLSSHNLC